MEAGTWVPDGERLGSAAVGGSVPRSFGVSSSLPWSHRGSSVRDRGSLWVCGGGGCRLPVALAAPSPIRAVRPIGLPPGVPQLGYIPASGAGSARKEESLGEARPTFSAGRASTVWLASVAACTDYRSWDGSPHRLSLYSLPIKRVLTLLPATPAGPKPRRCTAVGTLRGHDAVTRIFSRRAKSSLSCWPESSARAFFSTRLVLLLMRDSC